MTRPWATHQLRDSDRQAASGLKPDAPATLTAYEFQSSKQLARLILLAVLCGFAAVEIISVLPLPGPSHWLMVTVTIACVCVLFPLQVLTSSSQASARWPVQWRMAMLLALGLVTYLPLLILGREWGGMAGWLAGSVLLLMPGWIAWALFAAVVLSIFIGSLVLGLDPYSTAYLTVATLDTGLVVFGLSRLSVIISDLKETRTELAQFAVLRERMRFSRDLHDLLGYSLSAITLKAEFTRRLVGVNPERARDELAELLDVARLALADVRLVATGYRNMSLSKEAADVTSLLSTAGIDAQVEIDCVVLDEQVNTALATVLREAVTNMLRHSTPRSCNIRVTLADNIVELRVANDGVPSLSPSSREGGGLENLALRLEAVGGKLNIRRHEDHFEVVATAPHRGKLS